jgi:glycosyltransferase involved in cell wall biosynthesis
VITRRLLTVIHGPVFGGGFNQTVQLRDPLRGLGWETIAATTDQPGNAVERLRAADVPVEVLPLHRLRATPNPIAHAALAATFAREVRALRRTIREHEIDLVQAHGDTNPHAAFAAHLEGVAVVWQLLDTRTPPPLRRMTMPVVTRVADAITTWGYGLARAHPGTTALGDRHLVVFPPVDSERFRPDPERRRAARARLGVSEDEFLVGGVGALNPQKGFEWLVRALARVRRERDDVVVRVLGPESPVHADYARSLRAEVAAAGLGDAIDFLDAGRDVPELMPGLDSLVVSSVPRSEGIPTVILEAMACEVPVVSTEVGAIDEVVEEGDTGLLVPPEDDAAIAAAITRVAADRDLAGRLARTGRDRVETRYRLDRCAEIHAEAYRRALAHRAARSRYHRAAARSPTGAG